MKCKLDHKDPDQIPFFLCRTCNPLKAKSAPTEVEIEAESERHAMHAAKMEKRRLRKLRAELKVWRERVELMRKHNVHPADLAKAEKALKSVTHELYMEA